jgi:molybdopterin molybdotransferase
LSRLKGFQELTSVESALQKFLAAVEFNLNKTCIPLLNAQNRVLAARVIADTDLPRADRSAVDGYAVKSAETSGATQFKPKIFKLTKGTIIDSNQARQVWTGNSISSSADAVVMLENTRINGERLEVWSPVTRWENISRKGEDVKKGEIAVEDRIRLKPHHLGLIAALGISKMEVYKKPKIAVLATGNELVKLGDKIKDSQVYDSNRIVLTALCNELGVEVFDLGIIGDDERGIEEKLKVGFANAEAVITSGGTSVGAPDLVPQVVQRIGKPGILVHGIAMRPGMPTALALVGKKPMVLLPGNPVAAMLSFEVFCRPLICRMLGLRSTEARPVIMAMMSRKITTTLGRKNLVRVRVSRKKDDFLAEPISARGSSLFSTMTNANGYVVVPENQEGLAKGEFVEVHLFDELKAMGENV